MKGNSFLTCLLESSNLKKVRIKVDPSEISRATDFSKCNGYEGYILREKLGKTKIIVLSPDFPIFDDIPSDYLENIVGDKETDVIDEFKCFVSSKLELKEGDPFIECLAKAETIEDIEAGLKQRGLETEKISNLYRDFISNE
jgi:hypothetical protein